WDFKTFIRAAFSSSPNSLAMITGNLLLPSRKPYSRWGGRSLSSTSGGSSSRLRKALASSNSRKSLSPNGVSAGEVGETIGSLDGVGLPLTVTLEKPRTS
nr:hypothetical protein [Tanacetum cinerariifolium]